MISTRAPSRAPFAVAVEITSGPRNIRYGWLRKHGYYISSCHVEAAARVLVARRCKQAGMHWRHHNAACENGGRRPMSMHLRFWSPDAPGFTSENDELESVFDVIIGATGGRGIFIYDRGEDNIEFYRYFLRKSVDFIVRLKSRSVISWKRRLMCDNLAAQCTLRYTDTITFDSHGKTFRIVLNYGVVPVRLPEISGKLLHMVVVKGFGQKPMMLLTTLAKTTARKDLWQVVTAYITRWRVEETIRYIKQAYKGVVFL